MSEHCAVPESPAPSAAVPAGAPAAKEVSSVRLLTVLGVGGAVAGLLIVLAFQWTKESITAHKAAVLREAVNEVLGAPPRIDTLWLRDGVLSATAPPGGEGPASDRVFLGIRADGTRAGFAIVAAEPGFADDVKVLFGYDPAARRVVGFKVLENKETPGLGDAIAKDEKFLGGFRGARVPPGGLVAKRKGSGDADPEKGEIDTITGATISSKTVIRILNHAVERWTPYLEAYREEPGR